MYPKLVPISTRGRSCINNIERSLVLMTNTKLLVMYAIVGAALSAAMVSYLDPTSELSKSAVPTASAAAVDSYLQLEGINGESTESVHGNTGWIEIESWSWGVTNSGASAAGTGAGAGKVKFDEFTITKTMDSTSPLLYQACASGTHYPSVTIEMNHVGNSQGYLTITLSNVFISSFKTSGSGDNPSETVTLNFQKIEYQYTNPSTTGVTG
jgi:type VI secretion system secreted protein Hcp